MFFNKSRKSTSALIALSIGLSIVSSDLALAKTKKPTQAQIDAAKKEEEAKAAAAKKAAAVLNSATKTLNQLAAIANSAQVAYNKALKELAIAKANARAAAFFAAAALASSSFFAASI